jgi:hypothetical protein
MRPGPWREIQNASMHVFGTQRLVPRGERSGVIVISPDGISHLDLALPKCGAHPYDIIPARVPSHS